MREKYFMTLIHIVYMDKEKTVEQLKEDIERENDIYIQNPIIKLKENLKADKELVKEDSSWF